MEKFKDHPEIESVSPPVKVAPLGATINGQYYPNDFFNGQWSLAKVNAPRAWMYTKGSSDVVIGIAEFGVSGLIHDEFYPNKIVWIGDNGPAHFHAASVGGVAAAITDNGLGVSSMGFNVKLSFVDMDPTQNTELPDAQTVNNSLLSLVTGQGHADIVNCSWQITVEVYTEDGIRDFPYPDPDIHDQIIDLREINNVVFIAASGNRVQDTKYHDPSDKIFPASWPEVIGVGATDSNDTAATINRNEWYRGSMDVVVPGVDIKVIQNGTYVQKTYTSYAAPMVAGLAALIKSYDPDLEYFEIENIIRNSVVDLGVPGNDEHYGYGRIDAGKAFFDRNAAPVLSIVAQSGDNPELSWSPIGGLALDGYEVYKKVNTGGWGEEPVATVSGTTWIDNTAIVQPNSWTRMYYKVRAKSEIGDSSQYSNQVQCRTRPDFSRDSTEITDRKIESGDFSVTGNYPNPFNPTTTINYTLPEQGNLSIVIFSVTGAKIADLFKGNQNSGQNSVRWNGKDSFGNDVASWTYFYRISVT